MPCVVRKESGLGRGEGLRARLAVGLVKDPRTPDGPAVGRAVSSHAWARGNLRSLLCLFPLA